MKRIIYISKRINGNKSTWSIPQKKYIKCNCCKTNIYYNCINYITKKIFEQIPKKYINKYLCDSCTYNNKILYKIECES